MVTCASPLSNIHGKRIQTIMENTFLQENQYTTDINISNLAGGTYFCILKEDNNTYIKRIIIVK